eukprot:NODE_443_length_2245_cov_52.212659_g409_i0.p1 GENE.NODE_443_length_2245_cov_52.212659_g409_i0~~NODE_443_length_2245_cov_52.212659_g409_i0.p1  ORF type:complete len:669 (+),score=99.55 NODE_443_length_2245_cov_52.212659_g409_i0:161-2167(+)
MQTEYCNVHGDRINVYLRIRPLQNGPDSDSLALYKRSETCAEVIHGSDVSGGTGHQGKYYFDRIFDADTPQSQLFATTTLPLVAGLFEGVNALIFAYGVTNAGKTHTVHGATDQSDADSEGLLPRSVRALFQFIESRAGSSTAAEDGEKYSVFVSCLEMYNERLVDLLCEPRERKDLRIVEEAGEMNVRGLTEIEATGPDHGLALVRAARRNLQVGQTRLNADSSRSHGAFCLTLVRSDASDLSLYETVGRLTVCDLAGSERLGRTQNTGARLKEGANINQSLVVLGRCLETLRWNQRHPSAQHVVPYREAKITRLFQSAFKGRGKTVMLLNASPGAQEMDETVNALRYSSVAREVQPTSALMTQRSRGNDASGITTLPQALSEIQLLHAQLAECRAAARAREQEVRSSLSRMWLNCVRQMNDVTFCELEAVRKMGKELMDSVVHSRDNYWRSQVQFHAVQDRSKNSIQNVGLTADGESRVEPDPQGHPTELPPVQIEELNRLRQANLQLQRMVYASRQQAQQCRHNHQSCCEALNQEQIKMKRFVSASKQTIDEQRRALERAERICIDREGKLAVLKNQHAQDMIQLEKSIQRGKEEKAAARAEREHMRSENANLRALLLTVARKPSKRKRDEGHENMQQPLPVTVAEPEEPAPKKRRWFWPSIPWW